jgi:hypothetical protein
VNQVTSAKEVFTRWSRIGLMGFGPNADTGDMADQRKHTSTSSTCDEVRSTRLHYRLRCLLAPDHDGDHRWTPELVPAGVEDDDAYRAG